MDVRIVTGALHESAADTLITYLFEGITFEDRSPSNPTRAINDALGGAIHDLVDSGDFTGKTGQVAVLYPRGVIPARRVIIVGLGTTDKFTVDTARRAAAQAFLKARELKANTVATVPAGVWNGGLSMAVSTQSVVEGALLGLYDYRGQKTDAAPESLPWAINVMAAAEQDAAEAQQGIERGIAIATGTILARDLVNLPPNICTPGYLAQVAQETAATVGLTVQVLDEHQMRELKMGALLAVAQGSDTPPRFIVLEHNPDLADKTDTIVLIGKGVTFDTGGYSLKTAEGMSTMKADMGGAAAVIGAMHIIGALKAPLHVVGLVPTVDNMISGHAYRPQEVITASNGTTIEVISTDAEGRLLLADALVYAARYKPAAVVDIATLTGSCVVALGSAAAGLFSTNDTLRDRLMAAADSTSEKLWPLPLFPEYEKAIESQTADIKNSGGRNGGVGTSATFLKHFVDYPAWAHIDMAGMVADAEGNPYVPKGATGYGARLLAEFVGQWSGGNE